MNLWRRLTGWLWPDDDKSVLGWKALSEAPMDDRGLWHEDGRSRLARVTRFPEPDKAKLRLLKRKADVVRIDSRRVSK
jgi:hypothetical protein